jgi:hypothetical protein
MEKIENIPVFLSKMCQNVEESGRKCHKNSDSQLEM